MRNLFLCGECELKPEKELKAMVKVLDKLSVDTWVLQEVGSLASLEMLNRQLNHPYPHLACEPGNSRHNIHLAVLSRAPFTLRCNPDLELRDGNDQPLYYYASAADAETETLSLVQLQRDLLEVQLESLTLYGVHLKSRGNPPWQCLAQDEIRAAESKAVANLVRARSGRKKAVLMGDFNDLAGADSLAPISALDWYDPHEVAYRARGRNPSTYWPKRRMRLDRILLSPETVGSVFPESAVIHGGLLFRRASDHLPVTLDITGF